MPLSDFLFNPVNYFLARRKHEAAGRVVARPSVGATICCANLRLTVQAGMSEDLWRWLQSQGWRPLRPGEDRCRLRALPSDAVSDLFDAAPSQRDRRLLAAIKRAQDTPAAVS